MGRAGKVAAHVILAVLALILAQMLAAGSVLDPAELTLHAALYAFSALMVEALFQVERAPWRFVAASDGLRLARSSILTVLVFALLARVIAPELPGGARTLMAAALIQLALCGGPSWRAC
ncbi:hypothetical protein [Caulobacter sp. B11]|uniref:hypothetical protein n=1 Tax=Caulobacter sp. B11 TaxID=2048899 RepID=UPI001F282C74|nr:hypothetical protein [Caulobacter sp. B11]